MIENKAEKLQAFMNTIIDDVSVIVLPVASNDPSSFKIAYSPAVEAATEAASVPVFANTL